MLARVLAASLLVLIGLIALLALGRNDSGPRVSSPTPASNRVTFPKEARLGVERSRSA